MQCILNDEDVLIQILGDRISKQSQMKPIKASFSHTYERTTYYEVLKTHSMRRGFPHCLQTRLKNSFLDGGFFTQSNLFWIYTVMQNECYTLIK